MKSIDMTGKTVDEAIQKALEQLNLTKDEVEINIVDEGSKGFFNLIGSKPAKVNITVKEKTYIEDVKSFINGILDKMNIQADIAV